MRDMERTSLGRRPAVLCVGQATLDFVFTLDAEVAVGHKQRAATACTIGGGVAANAAVTVARLGGRSALVGRVGADAAGDSVWRELDEEGVVTDLMRRDPGRTTPVSAVIVAPTGQRTVVNHTSPELFDARPPAFGSWEADAVLVDGRWPAGTEAALEFARDASVPCVVDVDRRPTDAVGRDALSGGATHLVFGEDALAAWTGTQCHDDGIRAVVDGTDAFVAVTLGERGLAWWDGSCVRHLPAFVVDAVDTTAAGDVFHGAFAFGLAAGMTEADALRFASAASAVKCTRPGARFGIPSRSEVESFLASATRAVGGH